MDSGVFAAGLMAVGGVALAAALAFRKSPGQPQRLIVTLPGLGLILDDGAGQKTLTVPHAGTHMVRKLLGLDDRADAEAIYQAFCKLTLDNGHPAETVITDLLEHGRSFSQTCRAPAGERLILEGNLNNGRPVIWAVKAEDKTKTPSDINSLADMLERAPFPAWRLNAHGEISWANSRYLSAVEAKSLEDVLANTIELSREATSLGKEALSQNSTLQRTAHIVVDGQRGLYSVHAQPSGDGVALMAFDVTRMEAAEDALARHQDAHDQTLDHLADGVAIFGKDRRLIFFNRAFSEMWELEPAWLADRPSHSAILDRLRERRRLPETRDFNEWKQRELNFYSELKDAPDELWTLPDRRTLRVFRQPHPMGGLLLLFEDMTNELSLKSQYNALIAVQKATLDKLHEGVAVFSADGRLRLYNAAFEDMWQLGRDDCATEPLFDEIMDKCLPLLPDREVWTALKARVTDPTPEARVESHGEMTRNDGHIVTYRSRPLPDGATLIAFADITASRRVEAALRDRAEALEEASRLKSDFVGHVSYQLRNPLTTIMGYAELMDAGIGGVLNDKQKGQVGSIREAADQLNKLIEDILDLATIDAGEMELNLGQVDLKDTIGSAMSLLATKAEDTRLHIDTQIASKLSPIEADEKRLKQVIYNLLSNAIRHTPAGGQITVGADMRGDEALVWVEDTGSGIEPEDQARVFESFEVGEHGGAGLGLSLVHRFVDMHGGWVELQSEPHKGTKVTCHLPRKAKAPAQGDTADHPSVAEAI